MERLEQLQGAVDAALAGGARYAEARYGRESREALSATNGEVGAPRQDETAGWGIRVLVDNAWGFAAASDGARAPERLAEEALTIARASRSWQSPVELAPVEPVRAHYRDVGVIDPSSVSLDERVDFLRAAHAALIAGNGLAKTEANLEVRRDVMELVTSEGSEIAQELGLIGGGIVAHAEGHGRTSSRSYPHHHGWDYATAGWEWLEEIDLLGEASRVAEEAKLLLTAAACPRGVMTVILDPMMVGTLLHETVGHATELDRMLGEDLDNFGTTFARTDQLGWFPYASPAVSVTADATFRGGAGSYAVDAEGVPAARVPLIENGTLVGAASNRESAGEIGRPSTGSARVASWSRTPMARITNLVLEPGEYTLDSMIGEVDDGVYIQTDATTDIDDNRELCAFGGEIGWRIRHGRLVEPVAQPSIYGDTHTLLRECDGVGSEAELRLSGIFGCGKGQPWQFITTGQGGPPARIRNVRVGWVGR